MDLLLCRNPALTITSYQAYKCLFNTSSSILQTWAHPLQPSAVLIQNINCKAEHFCVRQQMGAQRRVFPALKWSFKIHLLSGGNPQTSWRNKCKACGQQVSVPRGADLPPSTLQLSIPPAGGMGPCSCPTWMLEPGWELSRLLGQHSAPQELNPTHCCSPLSCTG